MNSFGRRGTAAVGAVVVFTTDVLFPNKPPDLDPSAPWCLFLHFPLVYIRYNDTTPGQQEYINTCLYHMIRVRRCISGTVY